MHVHVAMAMNGVFTLVSILLVVAALVVGEERVGKGLQAPTRKPVEQNDGPVGSTPVLSEEESLSKEIPAQHRCNSCKALVFQLNDGFKAFGKRSPKEWELEEVYETVCQGRNTIWQKYGAREIEGIPQLTGPGLLDPKPVPGVVSVTTNGGIWADRLQMACLQTVSDIGERELYEIFARSGSAVEVDEAEVCVKSSKFCKEDELDDINRKIAEQALIDAGRPNSMSSNSNTGFKSEEAERVTKPAVEQEMRTGKGLSGGAKRERGPTPQEL